MYFSVGIDLIRRIQRWDQLIAKDRHYGVAVAIGEILGILTDVLFIWLVARRRKSWVRWLMLPPVLFGIPYGFLHWPSAVPLFDAVITCLSWLAETVAVLLILTGNASDWFRPSQYIPPDPA